MSLFRSPFSRSFFRFSRSLIAGVFSSVIFAPLFLPGGASAEEPLKGPPELIICTQNLYNYGLPQQTKRAQRQADQKRDLISRMQEARCDLIAVQEVTGRDERQAQRIVDDLAKTLTMVTGKKFIGLLGESRNDRIRNGFLLSDRAGSVLSSRSFFRRSLPALETRGPAQSFMRGPLALLLEVKPATGALPLRLIVINLHFKSSYNGWKDPSGTNYETTRMEMAEAVREGAREMVRGYDKRVPIIILGDRNASEFSATSAILSGERRLEDFRIPGRCKLDQENEPECGKLPRRERQFIPLFATKYRENKGWFSQTEGSFRYRNKDEFIDEILIDPADLEMVKRGDGELNIGLVGEFYRGSDHKLLWAELNW